MASHPDSWFWAQMAEFGDSSLSPSFSRRGRL